MAPALLYEPGEENRMLQLATDREGDPGHGPDLVQLSLALAGRTRIDEMLQLSLEALEAQDRSRAWAIVDRIGPREYRVRASDALGGGDVSRVLRQACGGQVFFWSDRPSGVTRMRRAACWRALPVAEDPEAGPDLILACWCDARNPVSGVALEQATRLITGATHAARLVEHLLEQTTTDPLTGLLNRRGLHDALQREIALASRHRVPLSVLFIDLDRFKQINDHHGHPVGDEVLQGVAQVLQASLRGSDALGRIGGDELVILLPRTNLAAAEAIARRLEALAVQSPVPTSAGGIRVAITVGAASLGEGTSDESLLERADRRMLARKDHPRPVGSEATATRHETVVLPGNP